MWSKRLLKKASLLLRRLPDPDREALRQVLYADNAPFNPPRDQVAGIVAQPISDGTAPLRNKIEALTGHTPAHRLAQWPWWTPRTRTIHTSCCAAARATRVRRCRGDFWKCSARTSRAPFTNGSGRLELARAIASPANPLTARVYVNRVWLHHFGEGLVKTPGDFGVRTEAPVQQLLLDYLAATFMEHGWSTKELQRLIVLSATYQQSCEPSPGSLTADPENNLYSHMNRQRLDFEAARDTLLALGGKLDSKLGGLPVDIETEPFSMRRTVYALIDRQNLPGVFRTFDFSNPDTSSQQRFHTTVPQQALVSHEQSVCRGTSPQPGSKARNFGFDKHYRPGPRCLPGGLSAPTGSRGAEPGIEIPEHPVKPERQAETSGAIRSSSVAFERTDVRRLVSLAVHVRAVSQCLQKSNRNAAVQGAVDPGNTERPGLQPTKVLQARVLTGPETSAPGGRFCGADEKGLNNRRRRREKSPVDLEFRVEATGPLRCSLVLETT